MTAGLDTYVCVNPLLAHFANQEEQLRKLFSAIKQAGTDKMYIEHLNLSGQKKVRLHKELANKLDKDIFEEFRLSQTTNYKVRLEDRVYKIVEELGIKILGGRIIDDKKVKKKTKFFVRKKR